MTAVETHEVIAPREAVYSSCTVLPLKRFIRAYCGGDLSALARKGQRPNPLELESAWQIIQGEFIDGMATEQGHAHLNERKEAARLASKIERVQTLVSGFTQSANLNLREPVWKEIAALYTKELRELDYDFAFPTDNPEALANDLNMVLTLLKWEEVQLANLSEAMGDAKGSPVTAEWFNTVLEEVSKMMGFLISVDDLKTAQFYGYFQRLRKHVKVNSKNPVA